MYILLLYPHKAQPHIPTLNISSVSECGVRNREFAILFGATLLENGLRPSLGDNTYDFFKSGWRTFQLESMFYSKIYLWYSRYLARSFVGRDAMRWVWGIRCAIDLMPYNVFAYLRFSWQTAVATTLKGGAVPFAIRNMQHKLLRSIIRGLIGALLTYFWGYINSQLLGLALRKAEDAMEGFVYIVRERERTRKRWGYVRLELNLQFTCPPQPRDNAFVIVGSYKYLYLGMDGL